MAKTPRSHDPKEPPSAARRRRSIERAPAAAPAPAPGWIQTHWKLILQIGVPIAAIAGITTNSDKIEAYWNAHFSRQPGVEAKAALVRKIGAIRQQPESLRGPLMLELSVMLDGEPRLVPIASEALLQLVRDESRWRGDAKSSAGTTPIRGSLQRALELATKRPASVRWRRFWTLNQRPPLEALRLDSTNLQNVALDSADLRGFDLRSSCLHRARFAGADLSRAALSGSAVDSARFADAHLVGAQLAGVHGRDALFTRAWLEAATLDDAILPHASFRGARLACATLEGAALDSATFWAAQIPWASFHEADLAGVTNADPIDSTSVAGAYVGTAAQLDPALRAWLVQHGADRSRAITDWAPARDRPWRADGTCARALSGSGALRGGGPARASRRRSAGRPAQGGASPQGDRTRSTRGTGATRA